MSRRGKPKKSRAERARTHRRRALAEKILSASVANCGEAIRRFGLATLVCSDCQGVTMITDAAEAPCACSACGSRFVPMNAAALGLRDEVVREYSLTPKFYAAIGMDVFACAPCSREYVRPAGSPLPVSCDLCGATLAPSEAAHG